ncbi:PREDICTED: HIRA-interacting protein 3-like isoform X2 [Ipomoea nil]|uniref:HIRA-interacting protein 3-like isoform X2 n=1 Tax=Ipomoea nil TaxID=35883 RepID=UPI000900D040|nr:PREDICTED: HIRA-interacting protein 3-like isoform X2 [Ipomoea nil]
MKTEMVEEDVKQELKKGIDESQIEAALRSRLEHLKENANSFTLERVRRLIEKDLDIDKYAIDIHKRFIKQFLEEHMESANEDNTTKDSKESMESANEDNTTEDNNTTKDSKESVKKETCLTDCEVEKSPEEHKIKKDVKDSGAEDEKKLDDSPIMGVLESKPRLVDAQDAKASESSIKKAIRESAAYIRANAETMTLASVRRYLEEEMGLEKGTLDPFKKFIKEEIDKALTSESPKSKSSIKKTSEKQTKPAKKIIAKGTSDSLDSESDKGDPGPGSVKKAVPKGKNEKSEGPKKRKSSEMKSDVPNKKQKVVKKSSESNDAESDRSESEDCKSPSTAAKPARKKATPAAGYGEHVENLKSIIKACGMSIPPSIYKKAKQVPEDEREEFLSKELEDILSREGLSSNPSEKEIKEVKKKKERAKELEGIDLSNIVSSTRRRSTTSFVPPPKPKSPVKDDKSDAEDSDKEDSSDDSDTEEDGDGSQIDEINEDHEEDSD